MQKKVPAMKKMDISLVIFAGGKSSRMGKDKALLPFSGFSTLAEFQFRRFTPIFKRVYISSKRDKFPFKADIIIDKKDSDTYSPLIALISIFEELLDDSLFIIGVDTPFIGIEEIDKIVKADSNHIYDAVIAKSPSTIHPLCGIYRKSIVPTLKKSLKEQNLRLQDILNSSKVLYVKFPYDEPFFNINRPNEYESAIKKLS